MMEVSWFVLSVHTLNLCLGGMLNALSIASSRIFHIPPENLYPRMSNEA